MFNLLKTIFMFGLQLTEIGTAPETLSLTSRFVLYSPASDGGLFFLKRRSLFQINRLNSLLSSRFICFVQINRFQFYVVNEYLWEHFHFCCYFTFFSFCHKCVDVYLWFPLFNEFDVTFAFWHDYRKSTQQFFKEIF